MPITSPNLLFTEFLSRMNKISQVRTAEHCLRQVEGNTIVATKKKRLTCASHSTDEPSPDDQINSDTYSEFVRELCQACSAGDEDSKKEIERLAPTMATLLKKAKEFLIPKLTIDAGKPGKIVQDELPSVSGNAEVFDKVILSVLGPQAEHSHTHTSIDTAEVADAVANLITDISLSSKRPTDLRSRAKVNQVLRSLQPHRERPSKDK